VRSEVTCCCSYTRPKRCHQQQNRGQEDTALLRDEYCGSSGLSMLPEGHGGLPGSCKKMFATSSIGC